MWRCCRLSSAQTRGLCELCRRRCATLQHHGPARNSQHPRVPVRGLQDCSSTAHRARAHLRPVSAPGQYLSSQLCRVPWAQSPETTRRSNTEGTCQGSSGHAQGCQCLRCWCLQASQAGSSVRVACGLPDLDAALRGGLPPAALTEVAGPSGVGKTHLCMAAALHAAAPRPWGLQVGQHRLNA